MGKTKKTLVVRGKTSPPRRLCFPFDKARRNHGHRPARLSSPPPLRPAATALDTGPGPGLVDDGDAEVLLTIGR